MNQKSIHAKLRRSNKYLEVIIRSRKLMLLNAKVEVSFDDF